MRRLLVCILCAPHSAYNCNWTATVAKYDDLPIQPATESHEASARAARLRDDGTATGTKQ